MKYYLYKHCNLSSRDIEEMPFYEIEYTIDNLTKDLKNQKESEEEQSNSMDANSYMSQSKKMMGNASPSSMAKSINKPTMPKMPSMKMPKL